MNGPGCAFVLVLLESWATGCASSMPDPGTAPPPRDPAIAIIHARNCGRCHERPQPGAFKRPKLESALARHRSRVKLSESEWARLVDYLASL
jgi:hypothetical protein